MTKAARQTSKVTQARYHMAQDDDLERQRSQGLGSPSVIAFGLVAFVSMVFGFLLGLLF